MRLSNFQKILWVLAGVALLAFAGLQMFGTRGDHASKVQQPAFSATFELDRSSGKCFGPRKILRGAGCWFFSDSRTALMSLPDDACGGRRSDGWTR